MVLVDGGAVTEQLALAARSNMLCCGGRKEGSNGVGAELAASPRRQGSCPSKVGRDPPSMVVQSDFRKVSGISTEIFRQIETVENDHDASTAAALDVVERRGEMVVRLFDPRLLSRPAYEQAKRFIALQNSKFTVQLVEIVKRPGQTLGLYIREGNGSDRADGVFISRIALESPVYNSGCLRVGDEILAVNLVDVTRMGLDDVVIIMSIPRRLLLTTRSRRGGRGAPPSPQAHRHEPKAPPVVVIKKEYDDDTMDDSGIRDQMRIPPGRMTPGGQTLSQETRFSTLPRYRPPEMSALRGEDTQHFYNSRGQPGPPLPPGPGYGIGKPMPPGPLGPHATHPGYQPRGPRQPGVMGLPGAPFGPPGGQGMSDLERYYQPPPPVITEQPRPQQQHFTPYERSYPKTLESLAERIHSFYGPQRPGAPMSRDVLGMEQSFGTLGRHSVGRPRLARTLSDQRLPATERETMSDFEGSIPTRRFKAATLQYPPAGDRGTLERYQDAMRRLSALRQRTRSVDYASDTEITIPRGSLLSRTRGVHIGGGSSRSNSLPRHISRHRGGSHVRFENRSGPTVSEDESDGAVSAPELPTAQERAAGRRARIPSSPSVFTSDEYRAWLSRAPSTSAIYERIRQSHESLRGNKRPMRFTYSAENLTDKTRDEIPYYSQRLHLGSGVLAGPGAVRQLGRTDSTSRRVKAALEEARGVPHPSPTRGHPALRLIDINPAEFLKYKVGVNNMGGVAEGVSGILWVHLLAGRGLKAASRPEFRDLYCVLECDRVHKARTVVRTGDLNFDWDETFDLDLISNKELDFLIYSWDPQFRHKLCYKGSVHLVSLLQESPMHQLALKIEPRGTLYLKLRYTPPQQAFIRTPSLRKNALFGVDLDTVCQKESGGSGVPLIIARCIAEVERRGLDIIGLYRLCGSATKKRLLRDAFERNPRLVDLSSDNVPDINVITGILKDYVRELPEPLFTKCLYQMLVDALTVMLPDDPEGNAKLIFSILDCLPKVNKNTLFLLMDHLRLVASQSDRNKMTTQNLAICFGPVLMLQSEGQQNLDFHQPISILKFLLDLWPSKSAREAVAASARSARPSHLESGRRKDRAGSKMTTPRATPTNQSPGSESDSSPNPPVNLRSKLVLSGMTPPAAAAISESGGGGATSGPSAPGSTSTTSTPTSSITSPPSTTAALTGGQPMVGTAAGGGPGGSPLPNTATLPTDSAEDTEDNKDEAGTGSS